MANSLESEILKHADIIKSSLLTTFSTPDDDNDQQNPANTRVPTLQKSEYLSPEHILTYMKDNRDKFTLMSLNLNSLNTKISELRIFVEDLQSQNLGFTIIAVQEARINAKTINQLNEYEIPGYKLETQLCQIDSQNGGLAFYIKYGYTGKPRKNLCKKSALFESFFIEVSGPRIKNKKLTIGNIYRPGRNNKKLPPVQSFWPASSSVLH